MRINIRTDDLLFLPVAYTDFEQEWAEYVDFVLDISK